MTPADLRLYHRLQVAAQRLQRAADRRLSAVANVTTAQAAVLAVIASADTIDQRSVARALGHQESAVTAMVKRLMDLGLVDRTRANNDARAWSLRLTSSGRRALELLEPAFQAINDRIAETLDDAALRQLASALDRLSTAFEKP